MKFLIKLDIKQQILLKEIIDKILSWNLEWLDITKIKWKDNFYRCRKWKIRIIFYEENNSYFIDDVDFRWRIYRSL
jgi:mRNA-degrading endonuclease RelE of RelBE toxin-antitoxin system